MQEKRVFGQYVDSYLPALDGVILTVKNYAYWLNQFGDECYVAAANAPKGHVDQEDFPIIRYKAMPIKPRPPYRFGVPMLDFQFERVQSKLSPDLVHAHSPFSAGLEALRLARFHKIPLVASFHSKYYDDILQATGSKLIAEQAVKVIIGFYNKADYVWTVNEGTANTLREYGYKKEIEICPNGTDFVFPADIQSAIFQVNERFCLDPQEKVLLFVGQHILQKNLPMLLEACQILNQRGVAFKLLTVGDGYAKQELMQLAKDLQIENRILFAGSIMDRRLLCSIYLRADLFTFPSVYDNAPLVVREAAMACCPSVLVEGSNAAENARDGVNAYLCKNNASSLADAIACALADDDRRKKVGQVAQDTIACTWESVLQIGRAHV